MYVKNLRIYCYRGWPNQELDGFRIAIFDFESGVPGEMLWPHDGNPKWVRPEMACVEGWCDFSVMWVPRDVRFVAAWEQYYDLPDCDAASFDTGPWRGGHTWHRENGEWKKVEGKNLMLRVIVDAGGAVAPASLGRVKALYR